MNGVWDTEKHYFRIPDEWVKISWPKNLIKQILAFLGLTDSEGEIGIIDLEELAEVLQCSVRTLKNNNQTLESLGLIRVENLYANLVYIRLVNYKENFLDLYESNRNSTGYTSIQREALFDLLKIKDVNQLRIACRALYVHEKEVHLEGNPFALLSANDFKDFLPRYASFRPFIERKIRSLSMLFDTAKVLDTEKSKAEILANYKNNQSLMEKLRSSYLVCFKLHQVKDSRAMDEIEEDAVNNAIYYHVYALHKDIGIEQVSHQTILELTRDYGSIPVKRAVTDLINYWQEKWHDVSETLYRVRKEVDKLRFADHPIGYLRKIFNEYSRTYQEEGFFAPN